MGAAADARLALENELRRAIHQNEFELQLSADHQLQDIADL